jgi:hypothetical protein
MVPCDMNSGPPRSTCPAGESQSASTRSPRGGLRSPARGGRFRCPYHFVERHPSNPKIAGVLFVLG